MMDLIIQYKGHSERATFHVTGFSQMTIILGHTWLMEHNPEIDWGTRKVSMTQCPASCGMNATLDWMNQLTHKSADNLQIPPDLNHVRRYTSRRSWKTFQNT